MIKTLCAAVALTVATSVAAMAGCQGYGEARMTCADGLVYDTETGSCRVVSG